MPALLLEVDLSLRTTDLYHYGSAVEVGISWPGLGGVALCALLLGLLAILVFNRRNIYT